MNDYAKQDMDWMAALDLDDNEYTWPVDDLAPDQVDAILRNAGYDPVAVGKQMKLVADLTLARRRAEMELEQRRGVVLVGYGVSAFCGAVMGAVGMKIAMMVWGG